jgi:hypothetical protein
VIIFLIDKNKACAQRLQGLLTGLQETGDIYREFFSG